MISTSAVSEDIKMKVKDVKRLGKLSKEELILELHRINISNLNNLDVEYIRDLIKNKD